jgi:3-hydroxymyristoyl/3-hydroxydecanoyl-(acyl carrier protein) dehydratase
MGDLIDLLPDGRFHLRGRADRIVKIEGKRISLTRVEEVLRKLPETADAAIAVIGTEAGELLGAALVLTPEAGSDLARLGAFRFSRRLREKLAAHLEPAERPKRWRFVGRIPVNAQGKRVAADIAGLFETASLIQTLDAQVEPTSDNDVRIAFVVKPELSWFDGHFPGRPILAGVAQTHIAVRLAEEVWGFLPSTFQITRLKFRRMIQPGESIGLSLTRDTARNRLVFAFTANGEPASEGVVGA